MFRKIPSIILFTLLMIPTFSLGSVENKEVFQKLKKEITTLQKKKVALREKEAPPLQGFFKRERIDLLYTNRQIQLLILEFKQALIEKKLDSIEIKESFIKLIEAFTYLTYIISLVICTFALVYLFKELSK